MGNCILNKQGTIIELNGNALTNQVLETRVFYNNDPLTKLTGTLPLSAVLQEYGGTLIYYEGLVE